MQPAPGFFRGSEFIKLLILSAVMIGGWGLVWQYATSHRAPAPPPPQATVTTKPEPVVPDRSAEFETVADRTPMSFRDNAAYAYLLEKGRELTPAELAAKSRRDLLLTHLWERPELYRGVPVHLLGTARRVLRFESKLSKTGWLYEAWIVTPEATTLPYNCVFEEAPEGFPLGADVSERVVFNGYFLKILKYQAGDVSRGAPVLIGKIGWERPVAMPAAETDRTLFWSLMVLGAMFVASLGRWAFQLIRFLSGPRSSPIPRGGVNEEIEPEALSAWLGSVSNDQDENPPGEGPDNQSER